MTSMREWMRRLWGTIRRNPRDSEIEEELRSHLELASEDMLRHGSSTEEALRAARLKAGIVAQAMEAIMTSEGFPGLMMLCAMCVMPSGPFGAVRNGAEALHGARAKYVFLYRHVPATGSESRGGGDRRACVARRRLRDHRHSLCHRCADRRKLQSQRPAGLGFLLEIRVGLTNPGALRRPLWICEAAQFPVKLSGAKEIANGQTHGTCTILDSYNATNTLEAAQFGFLNILPLDEYLAHRAFDIQTGLINPGLAVKASRSEVKVASNMKHDLVSLGHSRIVTLGRQTQEQSKEVYVRFEIESRRRRAKTTATCEDIRQRMDPSGLRKRKQSPAMTKDSEFSQGTQSDASRPDSSANTFQSFSQSQTCLSAMAPEKMRSKMRAEVRRITQFSLTPSGRGMPRLAAMARWR